MGTQGSWKAFRRMKGDCGQIKEKQDDFGDCSNVRVVYVCVENKLVMFSGQLELDPTTVSCSDLLLLLQYQPLET